MEILLNLLWLSPLTMLLTYLTFSVNGKGMLISAVSIFFLLLLASPFGWYLAALVGYLLDTPIASKFSLVDEPSKGISVLLTTTAIGVTSALGLCFLLKQLLTKLCMSKITQT